ncbi:hypothetical protein OIU76_021933, partial [Salix suchowensis]
MIILRLITLLTMKPKILISWQHFELGVPPEKTRVNVVVESSIGNGQL